jgi:hypothetical protein
MRKPALRSTVRTILLAQLNSGTFDDQEVVAAKPGPVAGPGNPR